MAGAGQLKSTTRPYATTTPPQPLATFHVRYMTHGCQGEEMSDAGLGPVSRENLNLEGTLELVRTLIENYLQTEIDGRMRVSELQQHTDTTN